MMYSQKKCVRRKVLEIKILIRSVSDEIFWEERSKNREGR
jgi:hypothetical protein